MVSRLARLGALLLAIACTDDIACTDIGCIEGLTVKLENTLSKTYYQVYVIAPDSTSMQGICGSFVNSCSVTFEHFTPAQVTVRLQYGSAQQQPGTVGTFTPAYTTNRPNGPKCAPACLTGSVTIRL